MNNLSATPAVSSREIDVTRFGHIYLARAKLFAGQEVAHG